MRITLAAFPLSLAVVATMAGPVQAKHAEAQKSEESAASSCSAYQQAPDGSWTQLPCKESGGHGQPQTQHKPGTQGAEPESH